MNVQNIAVDRAVAILNAIKGVQFKIITPDGKEFGDLKVVVKTKGRGAEQRMREGRKFGDIAAYINPILSQMEVGGVTCIPFNTFTKDVLQRSISGKCVNLWGKGSAITSIGQDGVEVLRVL